MFTDEGKPYTKTGGNGVYERRHELPEAFHAIGKHRLAEWVGTLLDREELVMAMVDGSKLVKWLDVPDGPIPGRIRIRGARARCSSTVRVQTEVCRVCGLQARKNSMLRLSDTMFVR